MFKCFTDEVNHCKVMSAYVQMNNIVWYKNTEHISRSKRWYTGVLATEVNGTKLCDIDVTASSFVPPPVQSVWQQSVLYL